MPCLTDKLISEFEETIEGFLVIFVCKVCRYRLHSLVSNSVERDEKFFVGKFFDEFLDTRFSDQSTEKLSHLFFDVLSKFLSDMSDTETIDESSK